GRRRHGWHGRLVLDGERRERLDWEVDPVRDPDPDQYGAEPTVVESEGGHLGRREYRRGPGRVAEGAVAVQIPGKVECVLVEVGRGRREGQALALGNDVRAAGRLLGRWSVHGRGRGVVGGHQLGDEAGPGAAVEGR